MKKYLLACLLALGSAGAAVAADDEPIITFRTAIYENAGPDNSFTIRIGGNGGGTIGLDCGLGRQDFDLEPAIFDTETQTITSTAITCHVTEEGMVYVYGNAEAIDYVSFEGCYIREIDLSRLTNLEILNLEHNELTGLDLSPLTKLQAVYLTDNPYSESTPLKIGKNHPGLTILQIGTSYWLDQEFNLSDYPEMVSFDAYAARDLRKIDTSGCPKLVQLSLDVTKVSSLDVSKNPELAILNISDTYITDIDVSHNPRLQQLYCDHSGQDYLDYRIKSLDVSNNPDLYYLFASYNDLTEIDLSKNPKLFDLSLACNRLTDIDLSNNTNLYNVNLRHNNMDFAHLPAPGEWGEYYYQQRPVPVKRSYKAGDTIDFSGSMLREGTETLAFIYQVNEDDIMNPVPVDPDSYSFNDGILTLRGEMPDSVYVQFHNSLLAEYPQTTTNFVVKSEADYGKPTVQATMLPAANQGEQFAFTVAMDGASAESPRKLLVDFGDGNFTEYAVSGSSLESGTLINGTRSGSSYVAIGVPEDECLTALAVKDHQLYSVDLNKARGLREISFTGTGLYQLDLSELRQLNSIELRGNSLYNFSIAGKNDNFVKTTLTRLVAPGNGIHTFTANGMEGVDYIDLSQNSIEEFPFESCQRTSYIDLSHNMLTDADIQRCGGLVTLNLAGNRLSELNYPTEGILGNVNISDNEFTIATLPDPALYSGEYIYTPQAEFLIPAKAPGADLSSLLRDIDGMHTEFTWFKADGSELTAGTDYTVNNGMVRFSGPELGKVYCAITHPAFPALSATDGTALYTTQIEVAAVPTHKVASFVTPKGGQTAVLSLAATEGSSQIFFDWEGTGYDFTPYDLGDTYRLFEATTCAGAEVGVYCYEDAAPISVFSISDVTMENLDLSGLTHAHAITISGAGLPEIKLPEGNHIRELILDGNALSEIDFGQHSGITALSLSDNRFSGEFDLSPLKSLELASLGANELTSIKLDNPRLWFLVLDRNRFSEIDLSGAPELEQVGLSGNMLETLDVETLYNLRVLAIDANRFTFRTLPDNKPTYSLYVYNNQAPVDAVAEGLKVDLSEEAFVGTVPTVYRWFNGTPEETETSVWEGDELTEGTDFTVSEGITTFNSDRSGVVCLMQNSVFPRLGLMTRSLEFSGVEDVSVSADTWIKAVAGGIEIHSSRKGIAEIYSISGVLVKSVCTVEGTTTADLAAGMYVVCCEGMSVKVRI